MGETASLMYSLSFDSGIAAADSSQLRNPMHVLGESVSFGRFMSDSLAWDKWSNLSHKRYVEEAAKSSQPGSVAQKKAFFEDYYKKKALLAQEKAAAENARVAESHDHIDSLTVPVTHSVQADAAGSSPVSNIALVAVDAQPAVLPSSIIAVEAQDEMVQDASTDVVVTNRVEQPIVVPQLDMSTNHKVAGATESSFPLASIPGSNDDEEPTILTYETGRCDSNVVLTESEPSVATLEVSEESESERPLLKDRNCDQEVRSNMRTPNPPPDPPSKPLFASIRSSAKCTCPPSRQKPRVNHAKKENVTPLSSNLAVQCADKIKLSPKPLFSYMSRTPVRDTSRTAGTSSSMGLKDSCTPLRTPTMASQTEKSLATPLSQSRRYKTPLEYAAPGSKTTGSKWRLLGSLENKQRSSPIASSPFSFRTEERAAKRNEKLELKFTKASQKVQRQTKLKDKAESELKKLRQTLCFRARPLPSFYKERKLQQDNLLSPNTSVAPQSPRPQQADSRTPKGQCKGSLPPHHGPQSSQKKKVTSSSATRESCKGATHQRSLAAMISHENNSPNIQTKPWTK